MAADCNSSAAGKALYALGNLVRTSPAARAAFAQADGWRQLARMLREECPLPVRRKAVALAGDLTAIQATCSTAVSCCDCQHMGGCLHICCHIKSHCC